MIRVTLPDGRVVNVETDDPAAAAAAAHKFQQGNQAAPAAAPSLAPDTFVGPASGGPAETPFFTPSNPANPNAAPRAPDYTNNPAGVQWYEPGANSAPEPPPNVPDWARRYEALGAPVEQSARTVENFVRNDAPAHLQAVGSGTRKTAFALPDLAAGAFNIAASPTGFRLGQPSEAFANQIAVPLAEWANYPLVDPEKLPTNDRLKFNAIDYGTQGFLGGALLRMLARPFGPKPGAQPRWSDPVLQPYVSRPNTAVAGDTVAGAGAGTALTGSQALPEETRAKGNGAVGAISDLLAMLAGGASGGMLTQMAADGPRRAAQYATRNWAASDIPRDEANQSVSRAVADRVAQFVQTQAGGPDKARSAAQNITTAANDFQSQGLPVPSVGLISDNVGLETLDRAQRARTPEPFIESDRRLHGAAMEQVQGVRPPGANPREFTDTMENVAQTRRTEAQGDVDQAQTYVGRVGAVRGAQAAEVDAFRGPRQDTAARDVDTTLVDRGYFPARREKNRQFDEAPGRNDQVPVEDLRTTAQELRARNNALRPDEQLPTEVMQRLDDLEAGTVDGGTLADLRMPLADAEKRARNSGSFTLADSIGRLRQQINRTIEQAPGYAEANQNYQQFADTYRPNPGDPMSRFTRELDREPFDRQRQPQRGATPPSQTAGRFIQEGQPEKAEALRRGLDASATPEAGVRAAGEFIMGEMAGSGATRGGRLDAARIRDWRTRNDSVLNAFPEVRAEIDAVLARAQKGEVSAQEFQDRLTAAQSRMRDVERETNSGAFRAVLGNDPEHAVAGIFGSGDPVRNMEQARAAIRGNAPAEAALKAAVTDWLYKRARDIKPQATASGDEALNFARLTKTLRDNEQTLVAAGFTPDEMAALNRAQRLLAPLAKKAGQATVGSPTAENSQVGNRLLEVFYKTVYGGLKGGNMYRNTKIMLGLMGMKDPQDELRLVQRIMLDPGLANTMLTRNVAEAGSPAWNAKLAKYLRRLEAFKQVAPFAEDDED